MTRFYNNFKSVSELYGSVFRGNEIEFIYNRKKFYILPYFNQGIVAGVRMGEAYTDFEKIYFSIEDFERANINNEIFGEIFFNIQIVWSNFN